MDSQNGSRPDAFSRVELRAHAKRTCANARSLSRQSACIRSESAELRVLMQHLRAGLSVST